jgi:hypothetical protein
MMLAVVLAGALIVLRSSTSKDHKESSKESMDQCCKKKGSGQADKATWEHLSRQFFSSI